MKAPLHFDKVLRHAERQLKQEADLQPTARLDLYRRFLKLEEYRLKMAHLAGEGGRDLAQKRADLVSIVLQHLWQGIWEKSEQSNQGKMPRLSLVAVGGFGRGELNPYSDVDVLFLYEKKKEDKSAVIDDIVSQVLYMLWDVGFKVGHASRTIEEMIEAAEADLRTKTSLLEARFLCGDESLFNELIKSFDRRCIAGREQEFIDWRFSDQEERHRKNGGTVFLQEPQVKNGCGGLRDYHNLLWVAKVKRGLSNTKQLQEKEIVTASERKQLDRAYDFLLHIRTELHYLQKRGGDILTLQLQGKISTDFHYPGNTILLRTEALMREYYHHTNLLYLVTNSLAERIAGRRNQKNKGWAFLPFRLPEKKVDGFSIREGRIEAEKSTLFKNDPIKLLRVFQLAQQYNVELSADLSLKIRRELSLVNRAFIYQKSCREMLVSIFSRKGQVGRICRRMHEVGLLGRLFPEFAPLTCLVQHEFFHRYTADEHTLRCLEMLDQILDSKEVPFTKYQSLLKKVEKSHLLYLGMLLHDTGKSANTRHHAEMSAVNAMKVAKRLRLPQEDLATLVFLVDHHMTLSETARRKNLDDEQSILDFARIVQTQDKLDLLMLLTFADFRGTAEVQNNADWKELIFWQLYHRTSQLLSNSDEFLRAAQKSLTDLREKMIAAELKNVDADEVEAHFKNLPPRYFNTISENLMIAHLQNVHRFFFSQVSGENALMPIIEWRDRPEQGHSEVIIVTWDRQRLFAKITGAFAANDLSILSAEIFTRNDDIVIDTFRIATDRLTAVTESRDKKAFEETLNQALATVDFEFPEIAKGKPKRARGFEGADFPTRIYFDQRSSQDYTLLDIQTPDQTGLLYRVACCLDDFKLYMGYARVSTEKGAALDTFYLSDQLGNKVTSEPLLQELTAKLQLVLKV